MYKQQKNSFRRHEVGGTDELTKISVWRHNIRGTDELTRGS